MAGSIYSWSTVFADNGTADGDVPWPEGMARRQVNDSARGILGRVAEYRSDLGGALSAGGTANGLTVTANSAFTAYADGLIISFRATADNTAAATLNVNGIGAKAIRKMDSTGDVALAAGEIQNTGIYVVQYQTALNGAAGAWLLVNPTLSAAIYALSGLTTVDNTVPRFNGTGGALQTSGVTVDDSNNVTGVVALTASGAVASGGFSVSGTGATQYTSTRTGSATNVSMQFATTSGSVYVGQGAANTFAIKDDNALATAPWFSVSSTAATIVGTLKVGAGADTSAVPGAALAVTNNGTTAASLRNSTDNIESYWACDANDSYIGTLSAHDFSLFTNDTNRLTISAAGAATFTGAVTAASFSGSGASLTSLPAAQLTGTVASARVSGSYTGITGTGALNAGSITSGFGSIDVGADAISGGAISGTTGTFSGAVSGTTGTFSGSVEAGNDLIVTDDIFCGVTALINPAAAEYGMSVDAAGLLTVSRNADVPLRVKRNGDGTLVAWYNGTTNVAVVSQASDVVTYGAFCGAHWAQWAGAVPVDVLRGTVLETVDEMCEWPDTSNPEILPKVKVSDTSGSRKVYGVYSHPDSDGSDDFHVASLGAYVVRVLAGAFVQNGDLLESNGDGCARVQESEVFTSRTIAKVTAAVAIETYPDGSKLYPATLHCG